MSLAKRIGYVCTRFKDWWRTNAVGEVLKVGDDYDSHRHAYEDGGLDMALNLLVVHGAKDCFCPSCVVLKRIAERDFPEGWEERS